MLVGELKDCEVEDLVHIKLSDRLYFVLIRRNRLVYFCNDVSEGMKGHCVRWEWICNKRYDILGLLNQYLNISISSGHHIKTWHSRDICFEQDGLQTIGICKDEWENLMFYMTWIPLIVKMPVETYPKSCWPPEEWLGSIGEDIFNDPERCDGLVAVGMRQYHVSKKCLSKSPVLRVMLTSRNWKDSTLPVIRLSEMDEAMPHMEHVLRFMHTGKIDITQENIVGLILVADKYNISHLGALCERAMNKFVFSGVRVEQVIQWWITTKDLNFNSMCKEYLQLNLMSVFSSELFFDIGLDELVSLLEGDAQVIDSEYTLAWHVLKWLRINDRMADLRVIMPHINLTAMSHEELMEIESFLMDNGQGYALYEANNFRPSPFRFKEQCPMRIYTSKGQEIPCRREPFAKYSDVSSHLSVMYLTSHGPHEIHVLTKQLEGNDISSVDLSIVVHSTGNKIKFVKGVFKVTLPIRGRCGHKLSIKIPRKNFPSKPTNLTPDTITVIVNYTACHTVRRKLCF